MILTYWFFGFSFKIQIYLQFPVLVKYAAVLLFEKFVSFGSVVQHVSWWSPLRGSDIPNLNLVCTHLNYSALKPVPKCCTQPDRILKIPDKVANQGKVQR